MYASAMSALTYNTRHSMTGKLQRLTRDQIEPFKDVLEIVPDDAKPYEPGLFKPGKVGEHDAPEPPTDAVVAAQARYDEILKDHSPRTNLAREAKAELDAALAEAEAEHAAAEKATEQIQNGEEVTAISGDGDASTPEGEIQ